MSTHAPLTGQPVCVIASMGPGSSDEDRIRALVPAAPVLAFDPGSKATSAIRLLRHLWGLRGGLVVLEGTGIGVGIPLLIARTCRRARYVVSTGDAVGPWVATRSRRASWFAVLYELLLYRFSEAVIGWSPYLVGRALTFGAPSAVTIPGWAPPGDYEAGRTERRASLGIDDDALVIGIVGSLSWSVTRSYCYGLELVRAMKLVRRRDVHVVIVGAGDGLEQLRHEAGGDIRIHLVGQVPRAEVPSWLASLDLASLPQSCDGLGSFRYTTKLPEYAAAHLPVVTGRLPFAYDLDDGWAWRLPGAAPWDPIYVEALARLLEGLTVDEVGLHRDAVDGLQPLFDREVQIARMGGLLTDLLAG